MRVCFLRLLRTRLVQGFKGLERELRIDHQIRRVRQMDQTVGTHIVGKRCLERVGALRQAVLDDCLHAALTERPALLLIGKDFLQTDDVGGQFGDVLLRRVDDREALVQFRQAFRGLAGILGQVLPEPVGDVVQPLIDGARELRLPGNGNLRNRLQAALEFRELRFKMRGVRRLFCRLGAAPGHPDDDDHQQGQEQDRGQARDDQQKQHRVKSEIADANEIIVHTERYSAIRGQFGSKREHLPRFAELTSMKRPPISRLT